MADILGAGIGGSFDITTLPRAGSIISLIYKESQQLDDGSVYSGLWNESSNVAEGLGALVTANGASLYQGWFKEGKANGKGRKILAEEREVYIGDFVDNLRQGEGTAYGQDGTSYSGSWLNDLRHGRGTEKWEDGAVYEGEYFEGKKAGNG